MPRQRSLHRKANRDSLQNLSECSTERKQLQSANKKTPKTQKKTNPQQLQMSTFCFLRFPFFFCILHFAHPRMDSHRCVCTVNYPRKQTQPFCCFFLCNLVVSLMTTFLPSTFSVKRENLLQIENSLSPLPKCERSTHCSRITQKRRRS